MTASERDIREQLDLIRRATPGQDDVALLAGLVGVIRPYSYLNVAPARERLNTLVTIVQGDGNARRALRRLASRIFLQADITEAMTESGVSGESNFFRELGKRLRYKMLPPLDTPGSLMEAVGEIFPSKHDYRWVEQIGDQEWAALFDILGFKARIWDGDLLTQLYDSLYILSNRISTLSLEADVRRCLSRQEQMCFIEQNRSVLEILSAHRSGDRAAGMISEKALWRQLAQCRALIGRIQSQIDHFGTSLHQTYVMLRLGQLIDRMRLVLSAAGGEGDDNLTRTVRQFKTLVRDRNTRTSIRQLLKENVEFLAYRIAEHERDTGELYITSTRKQYWAMLRSALGGGVIISIVAIVKSLMHFLGMASFWNGIAYSLNYAAGFIGIYTTGSTLATKQPAMTASAIASTLDDKKHCGKPNLAELAILISEASRSQIASFMGNLAVVFPMTLAIALIWNFLFGFSIVEGADAQQLLDNQNPLKMPSILFACFTGVFLYLSGLISGYFDNLAVYGNIPERIRRHPRLKRTFSPQRLESIASYTGKHLGGVMGNLSLGFFLGMSGGLAGVIKESFGFSFDIRHITISTANFAVGLQGLDFQVSTSDLVWTIIGVLLIGFFNFLVSFALAFFTALSSRKIRFRQYKRFMRYLVRLSVRYPLDFIRPPRRPRQPSDFLRRKN